MDKNISTMLREVKEAERWCEPRLALELGTSQPTVNRILNGQSECKSNLFKAIIALHSRVCGQVRRSTDNPQSKNHNDGLPSIATTPQQQPKA